MQIRDTLLRINHVIRPLPTFQRAVFFKIEGPNVMPEVTFELMQSARRGRE